MCIRDSRKSTGCTGQTDVWRLWQLVTRRRGKNAVRRDADLPQSIRSRVRAAGRIRYSPEDSSERAGQHGRQCSSAHWVC
ncbi:hypothetical protein Q2317_25180, partial [Escherichia coli]|nr:hypothetical protein [Escherichia coli]